MDESADLEKIVVSSENDNPLTDRQSTADVSGQMEQFPQSSRPLESERARKTGKCNLRKSLAWDNAFFTSAGVLDPDELSTMIKEGGKTGKHFLPGIEEDICRSTDSISTLESESLNLESIEAGLFEDIRASIQKSSKASNRTSSSKAASGETGTQAICCVLSPDKLPSMINGVDSCRNFLLPGIEEDTRRSTDSISTLESESLTLESVEADLFVDIRASIQKSSEASNMKSSSKARTIHSLKKVGGDSNNRMQTKAAFKKQTIGVQGPRKLMKQSLGSSQGAQPETRIGSATLSLPKAPKVLGSPATISSAPLKRASLSANQVKFENAKAKGASVPSKGAPLPKKPGLGGSIRTVPPKPPVSSKTSSSCSLTATKKDPPKSSSSSCNAPSANIGISPLKSNRRKINSRMANTSSSSSTTLKTSSKVALKKKGQAGLSAGLTSSKLSSSSSPASSISEWSESSSSTSTVNQRSNTSRLSTDSSPGRSLVCDAPPTMDHDNQYDHISDIQENKVTQLPSENLNPASMPNGALKQPAPVKPSGLRMPSPKIGFFDGVKHMVRTPNGSMRSYSCIPTGPKIGAGITKPPCEGSSKEEEKLVKLQPARTVTPIRNMELSSLKPASPVSSQEPSNASAKISSVSAKACLSITPQVQKETVEESFLKDEQIGRRGYDRANDVPDNSQDAEKPGSLALLKSELNLEKESDSYLKDIKIASIGGGNSDSSSQLNAEDMKLSEPSEDENSSNKSNGKENVQPVDQIDGLSMCGGPTDLKLEEQKELLGNGIAQIDFTHPNSGALELSCSEEFFVSGLKEKRSPSNLSGPTPISLSQSLTSSETETTAIVRTPFAVKNSMCDSDGDLSTRVGIGLAEKTSSLPSSERGQKENS